MKNNIVEYDQKIMSHSPIVLKGVNLIRVENGTRTLESMAHQVRKELRKEYREYILLRRRSYKMIKNILGF